MRHLYRFFEEIYKDIYIPWQILAMIFGVALVVFVIAGILFLSINGLAINLSGMPITGEQFIAGIWGGLIILLIFGYVKSRWKKSA